MSHDTKKNGNGSKPESDYGTPEELARLEKEALDSLSPVDRLRYVLQRQRLDVQRQQLAIASAGHRNSVNVEHAAAEKVRRR